MTSGGTAAPSGISARLRGIWSQARVRYAAFGSLLGITFPVVGYYLVHLHCGLSMWEVVSSNPGPLIFELQLMPVIIGGLAYAIGKRQDMLLALTLRSSQDRQTELRGMVHQAERLGRHGSWEFDLDTLEVKWSRGLYEVFGMDPDVHTDNLSTYRTLIHPADAQIEADAMHGLLQGHFQEVDNTLRIVTPAGETRWVRGRGALRVHPETGHRIVYGSSQDVSDVVAREREAQIYKEALDASAVVAITDARGRILSVNPAFTRLSGYAAQEMLDQDHRLLRSTRMAKEFFAHLWTTIRSGQTWRGEICNVNKAGQEYWIETTIVPARDRDGKIARYIAISYDITRRKQIEAELWNASELRRAVLHSANMSIITTDLAGTVTTFNRAAQKMLDYDPNDVVGKLDPSAFHDAGEVFARAQTLSAELGRTVKPGLDTFVAKARVETPDENEWTYVRRDGGRFPVRLSVTPLQDLNGDATGYLGIAYDISAAKNAERQLLEANERALSAARAKSEFLANMSHEIRTPMNGVIGMCNLLLDESAEPKTIERLRIIQQCGASLMELINDVLDFSKLEVGRLNLEDEPFDPAAACRDVIDLFDGLASQKGLLIALQADPNAPGLYGDVSRFRQILNNLVSNAIKFTDRGTVELSVHHRRLPEGRVEFEICVRDSGVGIAKADQSKLFADFSQVDASTTRKFGGSGLGLAISKGLSERMGGRIWLESEIGQGSTFRFTVVGQEASRDLFAPVVHAERTLDQEFAQRHPLRILVAEDNRTNQLVIIGLLEKMGYKPDLVATGRQVLTLAAHKHYDLILMDCHMPELDGFGAARALRSRVGPARSRIVAVSASSMKEDIDACIASGMDDFLAKPISPAGLMNVLAQSSRGGGAVPVAAEDLESRAPSLPKTLKSADAEPATFDEAKFWRNFRGVEDLAQKSIADFTQQVPRHLNKLSEALQSRNAEQLELCAHTLKGATSNFHAPKPRELAARLEDLALRASVLEADSAAAQVLWHEGQSLLTRLRVELDNLSRALEISARTREAA